MTCGLFLCLIYQGTMDFGESFGGFSMVGANEVESREAEKLEFREIAPQVRVSPRRDEVSRYVIPKSNRLAS